MMRQTGKVVKGMRGYEHDPVANAKETNKNASTLARRAPPPKRPTHIISSSRTVTHKIQLPATRAWER